MAHADLSLWLGAGVLALIAAVACYLDITQRRLPNWLCGGAFLAGLVFTGLTGGPIDLGLAALHAVAALLVGMALYALGAIGAGDAKFYAALAAWFSLWLAPVLLLSVSLCGLVLVVVWFAWRRSLRTASKDDVFAKLPYGVAIAVGGLVAFVHPLASV